MISLKLVVLLVSIGLSVTAETPVVNQTTTPTTPPTTASTTASAPVVKNETKEEVTDNIELCQPFLCRPPNCRCASTDSGGDFPVNETPQLVLVTFDDAVTSLNAEYYEKSIGKHKNPDGCPGQATFYVSHEYTDYYKVHELWAKGHEIALHSITHSPYNSYWRNATKDLILREFGDQREMIAHFAKIPIDEIVGMRMPLFQLAGDTSYLAMLEAGLKYDSSWPTNKYLKPGLWPYTLDYRSLQDCSIGDCPTSSIKGAWVQPILNWEDSERTPCAMVDACLNVPSHDVEQLFEWMKFNFVRIYESNRSPFGVHLHSAWFQRGENHFAAFVKFLKYLEDLPDVYLVSTNAAIEYAKKPVPKKNFDSCPELRKPSCAPRACQLQKMTPAGMEERYMTVCTACPPSYPWLNNPFGDGSFNDA